MSESAGRAGSRSGSTPSVSFAAGQDGMGDLPSFAFHNAPSDDDADQGDSGDGERQDADGDGDEKADADHLNVAGAPSGGRAGAHTRKTSIVSAGKVLNFEQRRELEETFQLFDTDGSGTMEPAELRVVLWALGFDAESAGIERMVARFLQISEEEANEVSLTQDQFMVLMAEKMNERDSPEKMMTAFRLFDFEKKGKFGAKELRRVARELNEPLSEEEMQMILDELDEDGDGEIGADDWMRCMSKR